MNDRYAMKVFKGAAVIYDIYAPEENRVVLGNEDGTDIEQWQIDIAEGLCLSLNLEQAKLEGDND